MSNLDEILDGLAEKTMNALDRVNFTDDEWETIYEITSLVVEADLKDKAGLDTGAEEAMLKAALQNYAVLAEIRAGKATKILIKEALTAVMGGLGALVRGIL